MGSLGPSEILVILVLALLVLGPERLPQAARTAGKWMGELRKITSSVQAEVQTVVDEVMHPVQTAASGDSTASTTAAPSVVVDPPPAAATGDEPAFDPGLN